MSSLPPTSLSTLDTACTASARTPTLDLRPSTSQRLASALQVSSFKFQVSSPLRSLRSLRFSLSPLAFSLSLALLLPSAIAQTSGTWNTNVTSDWFGSTNNWLGGVVPGSLGITNSTNQDTATFGSVITAATAVNLRNTAQSTNGLNIKNIIITNNSFAYTFGGQALLLTDGGQISVTGGGSNTFADNFNSSIILQNGASGFGSYTIDSSSANAGHTISFTRTLAGNATTGNTTTLTLTGSNAGVNSFNTSIISDGTNGGKLGITKEGSTTWELGKGNDFQRFSGPVTINAGTLRAASGSGFQNFGAGSVVTLSNNATAVLSLNGVASQVIGSLAGGGSTGGTVQLTTVSLTTGVNNANASFAGSIQGGGGFTKVGTGTQTLTGTNTYTGLTTVGGGELALDFSAASTGSNILATNSSLTVGGGTLRLVGKANTTNSQTLGNFAVQAGASSIVLSADPTANPLALILASLVRQSAGGTLDFTLPSGTQSRTNGVSFTTLGGNNNMNNGVMAQSGFNHAFATVNRNTWASMSGSNVIALTSYSSGTANYTTNRNIDVANGDSVTNVTVNTLRFNGNNTLTLSGTNRLTAGGILVTPSATSTASISGGALSGNFNTFGELVVINNGAQFTIGSDIINAAGGATALTLSGSGTTILSGSNSYTGNTFINGTVRAGSASAFGLSGSGTITLGDKESAVLELNGFNLTVAGLAGGGGQGANGQASAGTSGGTVALGAATLTVGSSSNSSFGGTITGAGGRLVKVGTGDLLLRGANTSTGGVTIANGSVTIGGLENNNALGTAPVTLGDPNGGTNNARLVVGGLGGSVVTNSTPIVLAPTVTGTLSFGGLANNTVTMTGGVTGTNDFLINHGGNNVSFLNNPINNNGNLTITITAGGENMSLLIGSNVINVTINLNKATTATRFDLLNSNSNSGTLINSGSGSVTATILRLAGTTGVRQNSTTSRLNLETPNTFTGDTLISAGTLILGNNLSIQNSGFDTRGAGVLDATGRTTPTFGGLIGSTSLSTNNVTGYGSITALTLNPQSGKSYTYSGNIANGAANMTLTKTGVGTQILSGSNSYTGVTTVSTGVLRLDSANALSGGIASTGGISALTINGGVIGLGNGDFTRGLGTATNQVQITGGGGFAAYGANRAVNLGGASAGVTWGSGNFITNAGSTFILSDAGADSTVDFQNAINLGTTGTNTRTVQVDNGSAVIDAVLSGALTGNTNQTFVKSGAGNLALTAANSHAGRTILNQGTLSLSNNSSLGTGTATFASNSTVAALANLTVANAYVISNAVTATFDSGANTWTNSGVISGDGALTKAGEGTLTLSGANTYTGTSTVNGGTLSLSGNGSLGATNSSVIVSSGTLDLGNLTRTNSTFTISGGSITNGTLTAATYALNGGTIFSTLGNGAVTVGGNATLGSAGRLNSNSTLNIASGGLTLGGNETVASFINAGTLGGTGTLTASTYALNGGNINANLGGGTLNVGGDTTLNGTAAARTIIVNSGTLTSGSADRLSSSATAAVSSGATLNLGGNNQTLAGLTGSGSVTNSTGTLTLSNASGNNNFAGSIAGAGSLTKSGAGAVTLAGANSYTGATTINGGLLTVNGTSTASAISINGGGTLGGSGSVGAVTVASGGTIAPGNSPGTLTVASSIWNAGGNYNWQLYDAAGTAGSSWDVVNVNGLLDLSALASGNKFNINLWTLSATNSDVNGNAINFNPGNSYSWNIANYGTITNFNAGFFNINTNSINGTAGFANAIDPNGSFSLTTSNNSLWLNYVAAAPSNSVLNLLGTAFTSGTNAIITGGTNAFTVSVTNGPGANAALTFTGTNGSNVSGTIASTDLAAGASANAAGLAYTGTNVGTNEGSFTLTAPGASNSPVTGYVTNVVYDHASGSLASNVISVGNTHVGYSNALTGSVTASNASGFRVNLAADSLSSNGTTLSGISGVAAGGVTNVTATVSTGLSAGAISNNYTYTFKDGSTLSGASGNVGTTNISVTGGVYAYAAGAVGSTNIDLGNIHAGGSFGTNKLVVSNTASGPAGYVENLAASFTNGSGVATSGSVNALAAGSNSSALSVTLTNNTAGAKSGSVGVAFTSQEVSESGLGSTTLNTTNISVTGFVYTGQGVWNTNGGSWANFANWQQAGGTPGIDGALSANDTATFGTGGSGSVTLDGISPSLQSVTFSNSAASYTVASGTGSATLTLKAGDTTASINNQAGSHVISAALNLANDVTLNSASNTALNISGAIGGTSGLIKTGAGTATLSAANTFSGDTLVSAGTLIISGGTTNSATTVDDSGTLGGIGSLGAVIVQSGGTLAPSIGGTTGQVSVDSLALESGSTVNMLLNSTNAGAYDSIFSKSTTQTIAFGGRLNLTLTGLGYNDSNNIGLFQLFSTGAGITGGEGNNFSQVFVTYGGYSGNLDYYRDVNRWQVWDKTSDSYIGLSMADGNFLVVPEPSTYALLGLGALVMVIAYRRRAEG